MGSSGGCTIICRFTYPQWVLERITQGYVGTTFCIFDHRFNWWNSLNDPMRYWLVHHGVQLTEILGWLAMTKLVCVISCITMSCDISGEGTSVAVKPVSQPESLGWPFKEDIAVISVWRGCFVTGSAPKSLFDEAPHPGGPSRGTKPAPRLRGAQSRVYRDNRRVTRPQQTNGTQAPHLCLLWPSILPRGVVPKKKRHFKGYLGAASWMLIAWWSENLSTTGFLTNFVTVTSLAAHLIHLCFTPYLRKCTAGSSNFCSNGSDSTLHVFEYL